MSRSNPTSLALLLLLLVAPACGRNQATASHHGISNAWRSAKPPAHSIRYQTEAFNLLSREPWLVTGIVNYDARFADAWKRLLSTFDAPDALQKRLLSGPATQGTYWTVGGTKGFLYTLCQSNACSTTNLTIFYQPESSKIGGRLLQRCQIVWIGTVGDDVKRLINSVAPIQAKDLNRKPECQIAERHADTAISHIATPRDSDSPPSQQHTAGQMFADRFTWNEVFTCSRKDERLSIAVGEAFRSDAERMRLTESERLRSLDVDVFYVLRDGDERRWFHSWGEAVFDAEAESKSVSVKLGNGKLVEFHRFGDLPNEDAEEAAFDNRPFFALAIDGARYQCGMAYKPK